MGIERRQDLGSFELFGSTAQSFAKPWREATAAGIEAIEKMLVAKIEPSSTVPLGVSLRA